MSDIKKSDPLYQEMMHAQTDAMLTYIGKRIIEEDAAIVDRLMIEGSENPMPQEMTDRLFALIQKEKKASRRAQRNYFFRRLTKVCALTIVLVSLSGVFLYNTVDAFRYAFDNFIATFQEDHINLSPGDSNWPNTIPKGWHGFWYPNYLPNGYHLDSTDSRGSDQVKILEFTNNAGDKIQLQQKPANGNDASIDNESQEFGIIEIHGQYDGYWTQESDMIFLTWLQADHIIQLKGPLSLEEISKIAENLRYQK